MNTIPFFTNINHISEGRYRKFFHTSAYLSKKSENFSVKSPEGDLQFLMKRCGYTKKQKFINHREQWNNLERKIPKSYLEAIKVDMHTLYFTLDLDREEYEKFLQIPFMPDFATARIMPGIYQSLPLPEGITEEEAIEILKTYSKEKNIRCFMNLPEIKSIRFEPDGRVNTYYFPPVIQESKNWMTPSEYVEIP